MNLHRIIKISAALLGLGLIFTILMFLSDVFAEVPLLADWFN